MPDRAPRARWVACKEFGNEIEASIAVAILDGAGIPAVIRSNDSVGLFGVAFQGFSSHGVTVMVPSPALEAARTSLALARALPDEAET
jgi:Putative prokaryotic signal transducing protein